MTAYSAVDFAQRPTRSTDPLFRPITVEGIKLGNRIAMAPMTRRFAPRGVLSPAAASYYAARARGGVGLIVTEGVALPDPVAEIESTIPKLGQPEQHRSWTAVVRDVHGAGSAIFMQLWHAGLQRDPAKTARPGDPSIGPSVVQPDQVKPQRAMGQADIERVIASFSDGAAIAKELGFDGVNIHGAHGYLLDQFFWERTNHRTDSYGGDLVDRTRFAAELIAEVRRRTGKGFPIMLRFSQWKNDDFNALIARTPKELELFLRPLQDAGVSAWDVSTRRFWLPAFEGSDRTLAAWTKHLTGLPTMTVGCVGLEAPRVMSGPAINVGAKLSLQNIDLITGMVDRGEIDLVAIGRMLLANPEWPTLVRNGEFDRLRPYHPEMLRELESSSVMISKDA